MKATTPEPLSGAGAGAGTVLGGATRAPGNRVHEHEGINTPVANETGRVLPAL